VRGDLDTAIAYARRAVEAVLNSSGPTQCWASCWLAMVRWNRELRSSEIARNRRGSPQVALVLWRQLTHGGAERAKRPANERIAR